MKHRTIYHCLFYQLGGFGRRTPAWLRDWHCSAEKHDKPQALEGFCYLGLICGGETAGGEPSIKPTCLDCVRVSTARSISCFSTYEQRVWVSSSGAFTDKHTHICLTDIICSTVSDSSLKASPLEGAELQPKWPRCTKMPRFTGRPELTLTAIREQHRRSVPQIPDMDQHSPSEANKDSLQRLELRVCVCGL